MDDYYQQNTLDLDYYQNSSASIESYIEEEKFIVNPDEYGVPSLSTAYPEYQAPENFSNPGPMKSTRPVRSTIKTNIPRNYSPSPSEYGGPSQKIKLGRPSKSNSTSKMANYARNYRQHKKEETQILIERNKELVEENRSLQTRNKALQIHLKDLENEMMALRSVVNKDQQIASIVANLGGSASSSEIPGDGGICLHIVGGRVQVEVCSTCNLRVRDRAMACRQSQIDPFFSQHQPSDLNYF